MCLTFAQMLTGSVMPNRMRCELVCVVCDMCVCVFVCVRYSCVYIHMYDVCADVD